MRRYLMSLPMVLMSNSHPQSLTQRPLAPVTWECSSSRGTPGMYLLPFLESKATFYISILYDTIQIKVPDPSCIKTHREIHTHILLLSWRCVET